MFHQPFDFSLQRSAVQAIGWYLFFLLLSFLGGAFIGLAIGAIANIPVTYDSGLRMGMRIGPLIPVVLGILVMRNRPLMASNVLITAIAFVLAFLFGFLGAGILLAYLTTRPTKDGYVAARAEIFS